jgi:hypothetical protein
LLRIDSNAFRRPHKAPAKSATAATGDTRAMMSAAGRTRAKDHTIIGRRRA